MKITALILGAGNSSRMKAEKSKMLLEIGGIPVLRRTVEIFEAIDEIEKIIVTARACDKEEFRRILSGVRKPVLITEGGATRQTSVAGAFRLIDTDTELLLIHDGARPLVERETVLNTISCAQRTGAAAVGVPVKDTIKQVNAELEIVATPERSTLYSIQTPQIFRCSLYAQALEKAVADGVDLTDDCQLVERLGAAVTVVTGAYSNIKITTQEDIPLAESILKLRGES